MFRNSFDWESVSSDPNDELFGDVVENVGLEEAEEYDAALVGEPYDGAVIGRKGARDGPDALRKQLESTKTHHIDAGPVSSVADIGDIEIDSDKKVSGVQEEVRDAVSDLYDLSFPVFLGGDNSLSYANASSLLEKGSLGVISFDAHFDCREVFDEPSSGTPYRQLHEAGLDEFAVVGARHFENSTEYAEYVEEKGGEVVTAEEVGEDSVKAADLALDAMADVDSIYVSVDLDVLDSSAAPGVSAPTPGGVTTRELYRMLRVIASDSRVAGFEVVECAPRLDDGDMTAKAGARAVAHLLSCLRLGGD